MEGMETVEGNEKHCKSRCVADLRAGMVLGMLGLSKQQSAATAMYSPNTGNRCLASTKQLERQRLHTDRPSMGYKATCKELKNPGYFCVTTAEQPAYIWVVEGSHSLIAKAKPGTSHGLKSTNAELKQLTHTRCSSRGVTSYMPVLVTKTTLPLGHS